ncbi:MAG: response regulator transcription factor [Chloroflexi bacterium]|nr:response regulator transcription factor [Chloroflexota bacterium]
MTTILLVGGDDNLSADLAELLTVAGLQVVGTPASAAESLAQARTLQPDVMLALSTVGLDSSGGLETIRALKRAAPAAHVIIWSARDNTLFIERMLNIGVSAYVLKSAPFDDLLHIVRRVAAGETPGFVAARQHA